MANTDFSVLLKAVLDKSGINTELKQVQEIVNKYSIDIMPELETASLRNQMKAVSKDIANDFNKAFGTNLTGNDVFKAFETQVKNVQKAEKAQKGLIESMAKVREQSEKTRKEEEKRQQMAQNNAINKSLDEEYQKRQKNLEITRKQTEAIQKQDDINRKTALEYTQNASRKLSNAVSKYSHGDSTEATNMIKRMNRGVVNFGNLEDVEGTAKRLDAVIDDIITKLKKGHNESLKAANAEIKAEQKKQKIISDFNKQQDKAIPNGVDDLIKKREQEAKSFAESLRQQMQEVSQIEQLATGGAKNDYSVQIAKLQGDFRELGLTEDEVVGKTQKISSALQTLKAELSKPVNQQNFDVIKTANDTIQRELIETSNEYARLKAVAKGFATEQQRLTLANTIEAWNQKNSAATKSVIQQNEKYIASLRDLDTTIDRVSFDAIKNGFKQAENSMRGLGKLGASFRNQMKQAASSFTTWLSASTAVMALISKTREAITELKEIDTLLTEISKANDKLSKSQLTGIGDRSFETASKYGRKATDYLAGVQEMSRAGYYQNAEAMGELSVKAQGAGAMTADVANSFIVATDKAYKLNGSLSDLTRIMDGINYITNYNAVNMTELSEGFSIVASTAASFGVEADELTAALGTMAASTQQSGSEVARAFRAILLNIRQISDEEEGIDAEGLTKYEEACNALDVKLKETKNGVQELRDPMEVLRELSVEYNKLSDTDIRKVNLLNSVGGKVYHVIQKCITRMNLIAGNPLEPCTTI